MAKIKDIQTALRDRSIDAWFFYDHHHRDPIAYRILGLPESSAVSRRWFYLVSAYCEPLNLLQQIEVFQLASLPGKKRIYAAREELVDNLRATLAEVRDVAMQFSPD